MEFKNISTEALNNTLAKALNNYDGSAVAKSVIAVLTDEINKRNEFKSFFAR